MKRIRTGDKLSVKLSLPEDLPWKIFGAVCADLGFTRLTDPDIFGAVRNRSYDALVSATARYEPRSMLRTFGPLKSRAYGFYRRYQLNALLKKYPFKGIDTLSPAVKKFFQAEDTCRSFNKENYKALLKLNDVYPPYLGIIEEMRRDIKRILGEVPDITSIYGHAMHGPGAAVGDLYKKGKVTSYFKWSQLPYTVTAAARPYAKEVIESDPRWVGALHNWYREKFSIPMWSPIDIDSFWNQVLRVVDGNRITSVPKTALTDRTIAIEPLLNVFCQLGVDRVIRKRLKRLWKYDLDDQTLNQRLAEEGSVSNAFVTVDLSAASDTISKKICEILLPSAWYALLLDLRSPSGELEGTAVPFEKISSMGNGYTFAIETLIFGAIARCAIRRTKSERKSAVYGDDIIVPSTAFSCLADLLRLCGFTLNDDKSFSDGPFRESCGADFFLGYDVRPVFLTRKIRGLPDVLYIHNVLIDLSNRLDWTWEVDFSRTLSLIRKYIPDWVKKNVCGPPSESFDTYMFSNRRLKRDKYGCWTHLAIIPRAKRFNKHTDFFFRKLMFQPRAPSNKWALRNLSDTGNAFDVTKRGFVHFKCTTKRLLEIRGSLRP